MPKTKPYKYVLLDGKNHSRAVCVATSNQVARDKFLARGIGIFTGWSIEKRGLATAADVHADARKDEKSAAKPKPAEAAEAAPAPSAPTSDIKIGDRVRVVSTSIPNQVGEPGTIYTIVCPCDFGVEGCWMGKSAVYGIKHLQSGYTVIEKVEGEPTEETPEPEPRNFKVGDRVRMTEAGHKRYGESKDNPRGVTGTICEINGRIDVDWDNGTCNAYTAPDQLELAPEEPLQHGFKVGQRVRRVKQPNSSAVPVGSTGTVIPPLPIRIANKGKFVFIEWDHLKDVPKAHEEYLAGSLPEYVEAIPDDEGKKPAVDPCEGCHSAPDHCQGHNECVHVGTRRTMKEQQQTIEDQARRIENYARDNADLRRRLDKWETHTDARVKELEKQLQNARLGIPTRASLEARILAIRETYMAVMKAALQIEKDFKIRLVF